MNSKIPFFLALIITLIACNKDNPDTNGYTVKGKIYLENNPEKNITVTIDNMANWRTTTDDQGNFTISNVTEGEHSLSMYKMYENGIYSQKEEQITVNADVEMNDLLLPSPLYLSDPFEIESDKMTLEWSQANTVDFYEYKLYKKEDEGLDETTGDLIYVGTSIEDTKFVDTELFPDKEYYYRVYLMNQYGLLGGSNIVSATTLAAELIPDGGFELIDSNTNYWNLIEHGTLVNEITNTTSAEGDRCLYNENDLSYTNGNINTYTVMELKMPISIEPNRNYEISGWMRAMGEHGTLTDSVWIMTFQGNQTINIVSLGVGATQPPFILEDTGWVYKSEIFHVTESTPITIKLLMPFQHVWIDGLKLTPL